MPQEILGPRSRVAKQSRTSNKLLAKQSSSAPTSELIEDCSMYGQEAGRLPFACRYSKLVSGRWPGDVRNAHDFSKLVYCHRSLEYLGKISALPIIIQVSDKVLRLPVESMQYRPEHSESNPVTSVRYSPSDPSLCISFGHRAIISSLPSSKHPSFLKTLKSSTQLQQRPL